VNKHEALISVAQLQQMVRLDADTGRLYWLARTSELMNEFKRNNARCLKSWNSRCAGKEAFTTNQGMGYFHGAIFDNKFLAHRIVFAIHYGEWPKSEVDHINGDKRDNRPGNLRSVSHRVNMCNQRHRRSNTSGFMGVSLVSSRGNYEAYIHVQGKKISLGRHKTAEDAGKARQVALKEYGYHQNHGEKAA